jgi:hypothetical protein
LRREHARQHQQRKGTAAAAVAAAGMGDSHFRRVVLLLRALMGSRLQLVRTKLA